MQLFTHAVLTVCAATLASAATPGKLRAAGEHLQVDIGQANQQPLASKKGTAHDEVAPSSRKNKPALLLLESSVHDAVDVVNGNVAHKHVAADVGGTMVAAYSAALLVMVTVVSIMFYPMGITVVFQVVVYVCCLAFVKIAMKAVFGYGYDYPKFVTSVHLFLSSTAAFSVLVFRRMSTGQPIAIPTKSELCFGILPIALTFGLSIGSENSALVFVSAAFSEVVAASNPVMSALLTWACGMPFHPMLLMPIGVVVTGCIISITGEVYFSAFGLGLLLFAVFCRALKAVMQQKLMTGETKDKFDPVTLMAWTCGFSFLELLAYSLATEGTAPIHDFVAAPDMVGLASAIGFSAIVAVTLNISALFVIKQLGAVGMQMVSQMKSLLVVIGGIALLSETFTITQQIGFATVLSGVYWYSRMKRELEPAGAKSGGH